MVLPMAVAGTSAANGGGMYGSSAVMAHVQMNVSVAQIFGDLQMMVCLPNTLAAAVRGSPVPTRAM